MSKYNTDHLIRVTVRPFKEARFYRYKKGGLKGFFRDEVKEGFYSILSADPYTKEVPDDHTFKDGVLYENPEVLLEFAGEIWVSKTFKTLAEAQSYADEFTNGWNWKEIT